MADGASAPVQTFAIDFLQGREDHWCRATQITHCFPNRTGYQPVGEMNRPNAAFVRSDRPNQVVLLGRKGLSPSERAWASMYMKKITREPHQLDQDWHPCFKSHRITRNCGGLIYFLRVKDKVVIPRDGYSCAEALFQAVQSLQVLYPQSTMQIA